MTTKEALAALVRTVSTADLAREADVSTKTIYRIRQLTANPSLEMVANIEAAVAKLAPKRRVAGKQAA